MDSGQHANEHAPGPFRRFFGLLLTVVIVVGVVWGVRVFVCEPFYVPSGSMETTVMTGDRLFAQKVSYHFEEPQIGDIVVFSDPQVPSRNLVKRVVATEGQTVSYENGLLYVDGVPQDEPYVQGESYPLSTTAGNVSISYPYTVPEGCLWVMGDNRENSSDSRYFGPIEADSIIGQAFAIYWPFERIGLLE